MQRRDALRRFALAPIACVTWRPPKPVEVSQAVKSFIERAKYLDYTEEDYLQCSLLLRDHEGHKIWSPPIRQVTLTKQPFKVVMSVKYDSVSRDIAIKSMQFVDKDQRMLFLPRSCPVRAMKGDILSITYTIALD